MSDRDNATGSKTDLPLAKVEPISNGGSASETAYLRRREKPAQLQPERGVGICERNNSADTKLSQEGGGGCAPGARVESCSPWRSTVEQISTCSSWRTPRRGRWMPEGGCDPMGSPCWSRLLPGSVAAWREEPTPEHVCWQGLRPHGGPTLE